MDGEAGPFGDLPDRQGFGRFHHGISLYDLRARSKLRVVERKIEKRKEYGIHGLRETLVVREATAKSMRSNRGKDTKPEWALRRALWAAGLRGYRKNVKGLPGKPDVVFGRGKLAVFVHGCYWHQCPHCRRNRTPSTNAAYWQAKFEANRVRDERNVAELEAMGWQVLVVWECETKDVLAAVDRVRSFLSSPDPER